MNLIIGENSQISKFLPSHFKRISSRSIDFDYIKKNHCEKIFICFAEQRTFDSNLTEKDFVDINVDYTSKVLDEINEYTDKIIIFGTAELWNQHEGAININSKIDYKYSPYIKSKHILHDKIMERKIQNKLQNVIQIHPFNFNSLERRKGFLFEKIYRSLLSDEKTKVGNLDINRDIIHVNYLVEETLKAEKDSIIGSGKLTNIRQFVKSLFDYYDKNYDELIEEEITLFSNNNTNSFWLETDKVYENLLKDTINEIDKKKVKYEI